jgi:hypothetical protein
MTLIYLEGLDRCGKTTMTELLEKEGFSVMHFSAPPKSMTSTDYFAYVLDLIYKTYMKRIVWDRTPHWGELVWPYIFNRPPKLSIEQVLLIEQALCYLHRDIHRIYMYDSDRDALVQRLQRDKEVLTEQLVDKTIVCYENYVLSNAVWHKITLPEVQENSCKILQLLNLK